MTDNLLFALASFKARKLLLLVTLTVFAVVSLPMAAVFAMGGPTLSWLASTPDAETAEVRGFYMGGYMEGNTYAWGNCTWWAYAMRQWAGSPIPTAWGNANIWDDNAEIDGYMVNSTPVIGAIYQTDEGDYGHVAYVIAVDPIDRRWTISEMNAPTINIVSTRTFAAETAIHYKFIHSKPGDETWIPEPLSAMPHLDTGN